MMLFVAVNVVMIPLVLHAHVATHSLFRDLAVPGIRGGTSSAACCSSSRSSHDRRAVAAVLPAEQHRRQEDFATLVELRTYRHDSRFFVVVITAALLMGITAAGCRITAHEQLRQRS